MNECENCGENIPEDTEQNLNSKGDSVCHGCVSELPMFSILQIGSTGEYFGGASFNGVDVHSKYNKSKTQAREEILCLIEKLWGNLTPIEEDS